MYFLSTCVHFTASTKWRTIYAFFSQYLHEPEHLYSTHLQHEHTHRNDMTRAHIVLFLGKSYLQKQVELWRQKQACLCLT